jgi:hypothetical protein
MLKQHQLGHGPGEPKRKNAEDPAAQELDSSMIPRNCRLFG